MRKHPNGASFLGVSSGVCLDMAIYRILVAIIRKMHYNELGLDGNPENRES